MLEVRGLSKSFGGLKAVDQASLDVRQGEIVGLIGPNGAGKTTLFAAIAGFHAPDAGHVAFEGRDITGLAPHKICAAGMVRTFQLTKALSRMTVMDNMRLGATGQRGENLFGSLLPWLWRAQEAEVTERARELLERFKLDGKADDFAGSLSGGQRKLLEMARALMTRPTMVMLDEPMAGVNPALTQSLLGHIQALRDEGMTVLFVEHDMHMVRHISDWVVVMAEGRTVAEGPPETIMQDQAVVDAYLGAHHDTDLGDDSLLADDVVEQYEAEAEAEEATQ